MNAKAKGNRNERRSRDFYKAAGYTVIKAGASLGEFDLIAWNSKEIVFIQVKSNSWPRPDERAKMLAVQIPFNGRREMHRWNDRAREPLVRLLTQ